MKKLTSSEGDATGVPYLTPTLASHILQQYQTEGIHALTKSLNYGDGAASDLASLFVRALRTFSGTDMNLQLNASTRLKAGSTYESDVTPAPTQNMNVTTADVDEDAVDLLDKQLQDAESNLAKARRTGNPKVIQRYEDLVKELKTATEQPVVGSVQANDTADQPGMTTDDPYATPHDDSMVSAAEDGIDDPISDGQAFDMLIDGDPKQEEPIVQELTQDDGGTDEPSDQPLLIDDVTSGAPTL